MYRTRFVCLCMLISISLCSATSAKLTHRYSFKADGKDSAGNVDAKLNGPAKIADGKVDLSNENVSSSDGQVAFVEFGAPVLPEKSSTTLMIWFTAKKESGDFTRLVNIGDHENGEGRAFIYITPHTSGGNARGAISATDTQGRIFVDSDPLDDDAEHVMAVVIDGDAKKLRLFVDGKEKSGAEDLGENTLDKVRQVDRWLGKSSFDTDTAYTGQINEFRVYDHALSPDEVSAAFDAGADALPAAPATQPTSKP